MAVILLFLLSFGCGLAPWRRMTRDATGVGYLLLAIMMAVLALAKYESTHESLFSIDFAITFAALTAASIAGVVVGTGVGWLSKRFGVS